MRIPVPNINDAGYEAGCRFARQLIRDVFRFEPLGYNNEARFPCNNFVYAIHVDHQPEAETVHPPVNQPGTHPIPEGTNCFTLKLSNWASEHNDRTRVENEVAAMHLARNVLAHRSPRLDPHVFGWGKGGAHQQGWILMETMKGQDLFPAFAKMNDSQKRIIVEQMADLLNCFQTYLLPDAVTQYGRLAFDQKGNVVSSSAVAPILMASSRFWEDHGPFPTYSSFLQAELRANLTRADSNANINGWRDNGIRIRLEAFLAYGIDSILQNFTDTRKAFYHGDFCMQNILYNPDTLQITALIDFDFAVIASAAEVFMGSMNLGLGFPSPKEDKDLHKAMLHGFPDPLPPSTEEIDWTAAKMWDQAFRDRGMDRPATIPGMKDRSRLDFFMGMINPLVFRFDFMVEDEAALVEKRTKQGNLLEKLLHEFGH
ncbi:hypothetical protein ANO11243_080400 [Dothideomycetidae sp. 11243]|nr:hypothetical protein ANO11243_080400 [fungal sp. No.11243]